MPRQPLDPGPKSLGETLRLIASDNRRRMVFMRKPPTLGNRVLSFLTPNVCAVVLYRLSHYLVGAGWRLPGKMLYALNMVLFSCEITPESEIGPGLLLVHPIGIGIHGRLGRNALLFGQVVLGSSGDRRADVGWHGGPVVGDNVTFGYGANAFGPITIGDDAFISARSLVTKSVPAGAQVFGIPARVIRKHWRRNPDDDELFEN